MEGINHSQRTDLMHHALFIWDSRPQGCMEIVLRVIILLLWY
jgi:hypothetical protein